MKCFRELELCSDLSRLPVPATEVMLGFGESIIPYFFELHSPQSITFYNNQGRANLISLNQIRTRDTVQGAALPTSGPMGLGAAGASVAPYRVFPLASLGT